MNTQSALLVLQLVSQWASLAREIEALSKRVLAGEQVTEAEIEQAWAQAQASVAKWDQAAGGVRDTTNES